MIWYFANWTFVTCNACKDRVHYIRFPNSFWSNHFRLELLHFSFLQTQPLGEFWNMASRKSFKFSEKPWSGRLHQNFGVHQRTPLDTTKISEFSEIFRTTWKISEHLVVIWKHWTVFRRYSNGSSEWLNFKWASLFSRKSEPAESSTKIFRYFMVHFRVLT